MEDKIELIFQSIIAYLVIRNRQGNQLEKGKPVRIGLASRLPHFTICRIEPKDNIAARATRKNKRAGAMARQTRQAKLSQDHPRVRAAPAPENNLKDILQN